MRANMYNLIERAVEESTTRALIRATKHVRWSHWQPDHKRGELAMRITDEVMSELSEWVVFDDAHADSHKPTDPLTTSSVSS